MQQENQSSNREIASDFTVAQIRRFDGSFSRPTENPPNMTFSSNNGRLAFVDAKGRMHLAVSSNRNQDALRKGGYASANWTVPVSVGQDAAFNDWYSRERQTEDYADANERAKTLRVPDVPRHGPWSAPRYSLPGQYVISPDNKFITWYAARVPDTGGWTSGPFITPYTKENLQKIQQAGYVPGDWKGIDVEGGIAHETRQQIDNWLSTLSA